MSGGGESHRDDAERVAVTNEGKLACRIGTAAIDSPRTGIFFRSPRFRSQALETSGGTQSGAGGPVNLTQSGAGGPVNLLGLFQDEQMVGSCASINGRDAGSVKQQSANEAALVGSPEVCKPGSRPLDHALSKALHDIC